MQAQPMPSTVAMACFSVAQWRSVFLGAKVSVRHFGSTSAHTSREFSTGAEVSYGQFGTSAEMSWARSVLTTQWFGLVLGSRLFYFAEVLCYSRYFTHYASILGIPQFQIIPISHLGSRVPRKPHPPHRPHRPAVRREWVVVGRHKWRLIATRLSWVQVAANSSQFSPVLLHTAGFSSVPNSLKLRRLKARRRDCLIASDTFISLIHKSQWR